MAAFRSGPWAFASRTSEIASVSAVRRSMSDSAVISLENNVAVLSIRDRFSSAVRAIPFAMSLAFGIQPEAHFFPVSASASANLM